MQPVQASRILSKGSLPRYREGQEERVQPGVIKAFSQIAARCQNNTLVAIRDLAELIHERSPLSFAESALELNYVPHQRDKLAGQSIKVFCSFR